jgi:hypothetical protein
MIETMLSYPRGFAIAHTKKTILFCFIRNNTTWKVVIVWWYDAVFFMKKVSTDVWCKSTELTEYDVLIIYLQKKVYFYLIGNTHYDNMEQSIFIMPDTILHNTYWKVHMKNYIQFFTLLNCIWCQTFFNFNIKEK